MNGNYIEISGVEQTFKTKKGPFCALQNINLTVAKGEFVTLIGHSGCGKSTLLNLIAGLTVPTQGHLLCANREIAGPGPERAVGSSYEDFCFIDCHRVTSLLLSFPLVQAFSGGSLLAHRLDPHLLCLLLTSDWASCHLSVPVALSGTTVRSPRVLRTHFHAYACRIYVTPSRASFGL